MVHFFEEFMCHCPWKIWCSAIIGVVIIKQLLGELAVAGMSSLSGLIMDLTG